MLAKPWISSASLIYSCPWCRFDGICTFVPNSSGCQDTTATGQCCQTAPYQVLLPHRKCPGNPNPFTARPHTDLCWPTKECRQPISSLKLCPFTQDEKKNRNGTDVLEKANCWNSTHCLKTCEQEKKNHRESYHHIPIWAFAGLHFVIDQEKRPLLLLRKTYLPQGASQVYWHAA